MISLSCFTGRSFQDFGAASLWCNGRLHKHRRGAFCVTGSSQARTVVHVNEQAENLELQVHIFSPSQSHPQRGDTGPHFSSVPSEYTRSVLSRLELRATCACTISDGVHVGTTRTSTSRSARTHRRRTRTTGHANTPGLETESCVRYYLRIASTAKERKPT